MNPRRLTLVTVVVAIVVLAAVVVVPRLTSKSSGTASTATTAGTLSYQGQPSIGKAGAPVTIALFEDFLCPHCAEFSDQVWPQIKRAYVDTGKARAVFFYFPVISQTQSPVIGGMGQCIDMQSNTDFWHLEEILMRAQKRLSDTSKAIDIATRYAPSLNKQKLTKCVKDGSGAKTVSKDQQIALGLGLKGTPSVLVNGKQVTNTSWAGVKKAIDAALASSTPG